MRPSTLAPTRLRQLPAGRRPPTDRDRAGNDLLAYAVTLVREKGTGVAALRALLDAGADPRASRMADGEEPADLPRRRWFTRHPGIDGGDRPPPLRR